MTRYSQKTGLPQTYQPGPFSGPHLYLQWGGSLPGNEQFSCGLRMRPVGNSTSLDPSPMLAGAVTAVKAMHGSAALAISNLCKLQFVKLNYIGTDGLYVEDNTFVSNFADFPGTFGSPYPPNQLAWCVSLVTGVARGLAHRGRFYSPMPTQLMGTDGEVSAAQRDTALPVFTNLLTALNALSANYKVAVFSRKLGAPTSRDVTGFQLGRVLDTQRRRRNKLKENY